MAFERGGSAGDRRDAAPSIPSPPRPAGERARVRGAVVSREDRPSPLTLSPEDGGEGMKRQGPRPFSATHS